MSVTTENSSRVKKSKQEQKPYSWLLWMVSYLTISLFAQNYREDRSRPGFDPLHSALINLPVAIFCAVGAWTIVLIGFSFFGWIWWWLNHKPSEPNRPTSFENIGFWQALKLEIKTSSDNDSSQQKWWKKWPHGVWQYLLIGFFGLIGAEFLCLSDTNFRLTLTGLPHEALFLYCTVIILAGVLIAWLIVRFAYLIRLFDKETSLDSIAQFQLIGWFIVFGATQFIADALRLYVFHLRLPV